MIEVRDLVKRFGAFEALRHIDLEVGRGESVGLLGENGAGKTTTMRILSGFLAPTSGTVRIGGDDVVFESRRVRQRIGYLPENVPVYGDMRVEEYLLFRARLKGVRGRAAKEAVDRVLGLVQLVDRRRSLIRNLSKGLRQRVGLADAMVHSPELLILDEPTSGLDPSQRIEVREMVEELKAHHTLLISSHILPEIEATCDRVVVVHRGRVVADTPLEDLHRAGERDRFRIAVEGADAARVRSLLEDDAELVLDGLEEGEGRLRVSATGSRESRSRARAVARLAAGGCDVIEVEGRGESLEELFVRLTDGEDRAS